MKAYEIIDESILTSVGTLLYYEKDNTCIIELKTGLDEWTAPLLFTAYVKKGIYTIPRDISFLWVKERVIPSGRQNISDILNSHHLEAYDEMKFLEISSGRCSQDSLCIKKIDALPDYVLERQRKVIIECMLLDENRILCFFADDTVKVIFLKDLASLDDIDKVISNNSLYQTGTLGTGGYYITFNNSIDIPAQALYEVGRDIPLTLTDFKSFVQKNVLDTSECCERLNCSRQNVAYMIHKDMLHPIKEEVRGNLFLKGEVERSLW